MAIGIDILGGPVAFVAAVHDGRDRPVALSHLVRQRIRALASAKRVADTLRSMSRNGGHVLTPRDVQWPSQLSALRRSAPLVLFAQGDMAVLELPAVAITGTADPTAGAIHMTIELATGLADRRWVIASGMTQGVDQLSLSAAAAMRGRTITVAAEGLLGAEVVDGSVRISESPPTDAITVRGQRRAEQLLAAIATKTIVVEAGKSSGALRTAEAAISMNRPVGTVAQTSMSKSAAGSIDLHLRHSMVRVASVKDADRLR
ncbi:DNA-processing protein DprA [Salinibacterium sp. TMP30]|uniref:DNA-processing protein DprA n=1 Tax=Salinibacterium sp. TMP30 TaxID=3138237 RepID=UPI0031399F9C